MILSALIVIIIMLIYVSAYFYYTRYKSSSSSSAEAKNTQPSDYYVDMHAGAALNANVNPHYQQEQSYRRGRSDDELESPVKQEYMANKYNTSYMQSITTAPTAVNYNQYMINTGLEESVVDSHREFVDETQNKTTGASAETVFSHDDAIVPSWGLRRRSANVPINPNSREVPSQTNEQLADNTQEFKYGLF